MVNDRDIRLTFEEMDVLIEAARRRRRELVKRNERMDGSKPGMIASNDRSIRHLGTAIESLEVGREALRRHQVNAIAHKLGIEARS